MKKLLYVIAHPGTIENSESLAVGQAFVDEWQVKNPTGTVKTINLFAEEPPYYTQDHSDLITKEKFSTITGNTLTPDEEEAFAKYAKYLDSFVEADTVLIANPMWNYFLPAELKQYLDLIQVSGKSFKYTDHGPVGLLSDKQVVHVQAAGGFYHNDPETAKEDLGSQYIDLVMKFVGLGKVDHVYVEGAAFVPDQAANILAAAKEQAKALADK